jgi:N-acetylglucosamine kinase-like BadF-type ATPase
MSLVCGIDGGAKSSRGMLALIDGGSVEILATGTGGPINANITGVPAASANTSALLISLLASAQVKGRDVAAVAAGCSVPEAVGSALTAVHGVRSAVHDTWVAFRSGSDHNSGVVITAGSGSMVVRFDRSHPSESRGGWGWAVGDIGSATDLGREALRACLKAADQGLTTPLLTALLDLVGSAGSDPHDDIYSFVYRDSHAPHLALGAVAPLVTALASTDEECRSLIRISATSLSEMATHLLRPTDAVVLAGALAPHLQVDVEAHLGRSVSVCQDGLVGAVSLAATLAGHDVPSAVITAARRAWEGGGTLG